MATDNIFRPIDITRLESIRKRLNANNNTIRSSTADRNARPASTKYSGDYRQLLLFKDAEKEREQEQREELDIKEAQLINERMTTTGMNFVMNYERLLDLSNWIGEQTTCQFTSNQQQQFETIKHLTFLQNCLKNTRTSRSFIEQRKILNRELATMKQNGEDEGEIQYKKAFRESAILAGEIVLELSIFLDKIIGAQRQKFKFNQPPAPENQNDEKSQKAQEDAFKYHGQPIELDKYQDLCSSILNEILKNNKKKMGKYLLRHYSKYLPNLVEKIDVPSNHQGKKPKKESVFYNIYRIKPPEPEIENFKTQSPKK